MKQNLYKIIIAIICITGVNLKVIAQCTPDPSITTTGVYPLNLPNAKVGQAYNQVLQFYITKDTVVTVPVFGEVNATIDSFTIFKIIGMPNGLSFNCNTSTCTIAGGTNGCANVSGTPTQKGTYPLQIILKIRASALSVTQTIYDTMYNYTMTVESGVNIKNANSIQSSNYQIYPNPITNNQLNFEVWSNDAANCAVQLFSMQGKEVFNQQFDLDFGLNKNKINTEQLAKGMYLVKVNHGNSQFEQKIIIE